MKRALLISAALPLAFANAKGEKPAGDTPPAPNTNDPGANVGLPANGAGSKPRIEPEITAVTTDVPMPSRKTARGSKSSYPFDSLTAVGASFGVKNKTARNLASIVTNANKKAMEPKKDDAGNIVYKTSEAKDAAGNTIHVPTKEAEMVPARKFFVIDVDSATDPDKASARVFREI